MGLKLVKVTLEFEGGRVETLEGEAAQAWVEDINGKIVFSAIHGAKMDDHPWKIEMKNVGTGM